MNRLSLLGVALVALTFWSWSRAYAAGEMGTNVTTEQYTALVTVRHIERPVSDAAVTPCDGDGRPLSDTTSTGMDGRCRVAVPADRCRLRIGHAGDILWSGEIFLLPNEPMPVVLDLYELARQPTNDPTPERMDGEPLGASLTASIRADGDLNDPSADGQGWSNWKIYYYVNDHLGTPVAMIDEDGREVWRADLMPFGEAVNETGSMQNPFRFPGQYRDPKAGFHYNWHRYFDSQIGRYLSPDPEGQLGGINIYPYARNNAIAGIDPNGLEVLSTEMISPLLINPYMHFNRIENSGSILLTSYSTAFYRSKEKFFWQWPEDPESILSISTTMLGGDVRIVFKAEEPDWAGCPIGDTIIYFGFGRFLSAGYCAKRNEVSINFGAGFAPPLQLSIPVGKTNMPIQ